MRRWQTPPRPTAESHFLRRFDFSWDLGEGAGPSSNLVRLKLVLTLSARVASRDFFFYFTIRLQALNSQELLQAGQNFK